MASIRQAAVAGMFYPDDAPSIERMFSGWFEPYDDIHMPRALIVPHAGYVYSGEFAAKGYGLWQQAQNQIHTVVVMGPAHRVGFEGIASISAEEVETPLGYLSVDMALRSEIVNQFDQVGISDYANQSEHSLEVHFPFIKSILPDAKVLPLLNGMVPPEKVAEVLRVLWQKPGVYFVISSDLSHFHAYGEAQKIDSKTAELINHAKWFPLKAEMACGFKGIQGLLSLKTELNFDIEQLALANSGDTAGTKDRVVGYGSWAIYENNGG